MKKHFKYNIEMVCSLRCNNLNWELIKTALTEIIQNKTSSLYKFVKSLFYKNINKTNKWLNRVHALNE